MDQFEFTAQLVSMATGFFALLVAVISVPLWYRRAGFREFVLGLRRLEDSQLEARYSKERLAEWPQGRSLPYVILWQGIRLREEFDFKVEPGLFTIPSGLANHAERLWLYHERKLMKALGIFLADINEEIPPILFPIRVLVRALKLLFDWTSILLDGTMRMSQWLASLLFVLPACHFASGCPLAGRALRALRRRPSRIHDAPIPMARLLAINYEDDTPQMRFQESTYRQYVATNLSMDIALPGQAQSLRAVLEPGPALSPLHEAICSNHLGVNRLITTSDSFLVIQMRSSGVAYAPNTLSPSASGALTWEDIKPGENAPSPFIGIERELCEELALEKAEIERLRCIGIARDLDRGGKPEAFFAASTPLRRGDIQRRFDAVRAASIFEVAHLDYTPVQLRDIAKNEIKLKSLDPSASPILRMALLFYWEFREREGWT